MQYLPVNSPDFSFSAGAAIGSLVAGIVCGLLPMIIGITRQRYYLARAGLGLCVMLGLVGGIFLAMPAALAFTGLILVAGKPRRRFEETPAALYGGFARPDGTGPLARELAGSERPAEPVHCLPGGKIGVSCPKCSHLFMAADGRIPPWCPHCGADVKRAAEPRQPEAPPAAATTPETGIITAELAADKLASAVTADAEPTA